MPKFPINDAIITATTLTKVAPATNVVKLPVPPKLTPTQMGALGEGVVQPPTVKPEIAPASAVASSRSTPAYHATLFKTFDLSAVPTYNFYTETENAAPTSDPSGSLWSLPRYVTLRWRIAPTVPTRTVSQKGVRPFVTSDVVKPPRAATFDVAKTALANGYISPGVVQAVISDPPPPVTTKPTAIDEDSFLLAASAKGQSATDHVGDPKSPYSIGQLSFAPLTTVVNFVDPSIAGTFDENRLKVATDPLHLTVAGSLAKIIGALEVVSEFNQDVPVQNPPPDFTAHPNTPTVMYIGYVIERYDMLVDGTMVLGRTILIDDPNVDEFVDQQVAYAGRYAYRIRSIVQWTHRSDVDFAGTSTIDRLSSFAGLITPPLASFYAGYWSDWTRTEVADTVPPEPPDEVTVRPVSWRKEIRVSWKMPNDPQNDLSKLTLVRAEVNSRRISDWRILGEFVVGNGSYVDRDVVPSEGGHSYIYALYSWSYHGVFSPLSDQVEARLSPPDSREELPVVQVAVAGKDPMTHASNEIGVGPTEIKANRRLTFYCRSGTSRQPLRDSTYLVEARSLSTGERALVQLDVDATDIGVVDA